MPTLPTILLVDDDEAARYVGKRLLRPYEDRVQVLVAANGQDALRLLEERAAETGQTLVLLDLNMPVLDGFEFLEALRSWPVARQQATHVVVLSSSDLPTDRRRAQALGADFQHKPLTSETLSNVLRQRLGDL